MGMTLVEKIFASRLKRRKISAGETLFVPVDLVLGTDVTVPLAVEVFRRIGKEKVFDPSKIVFVNDHFVPAKDIASANQAAVMRKFAGEQHIEHYFEVGRAGICHITVPEAGLIYPGQIVVGADSHTCTYGAVGAFATGIGSTDMAAAWADGELWFRIPSTIRVVLKGRFPAHVGGKDLILNLLGRLGPDGGRYKALEFGGPGLRELNMAGRFTVCNMAVECGAKCGLMEADALTLSYLGERQRETGVVQKPDQDARYEEVLEIDLSTLQPQLAVPHDPSNVHPVEEFVGTPIDQVVVGSCTNGRIEDFRVVYHIIKGKRVHPAIRLVLIPGSPEVLKQMIREGMAAAMIDAGALMGPSTCGPCIGGHMGVLGDGEVGLYTTNRNFVGRNGAKSSKVYLCSPAVAAYSALRGKIAVPI